MKKTTLLALGALIASSLLASAQDDKPKRPGPPGGGLPLTPELIAKFDKDGDGKLSKEERQAARAEHLAKYDKDGDGNLSDEEKAVAKADHEKALIAKFDKDGDGKLSDEEKTAIPKGPRGEGRGPKGEKGPKDGEPKPE